MKVLGIIAEYNPFHNGHKYHIDKAKKLINPDFVICVMSGNFVQRGEPAIFDKWTRAKFAIENGVDAVFELPVEFSMATAERFSFGGISLLNDLGADYVAFGTENHLDEIKKCFEIFINNEADIKKMLSSHDNDYLKVRDIVLGEDNILKTPNNILAFEYIKAIHKLNSKITPVGIKRFGTNHDSDITKNNFASASHIRELIKSEKEYLKFVPYTDTVKHYVDKNDFSDLINYKLISDGPEVIKDYAQVREGLENRIYKSALMNLNTDELILEIKTKRYAYTAISRMLFSALLNIKKQDLKEKPLYARLLAANKNGRDFLSEFKDKISVPVITKPSEIYNLSQDIINQAEKDFFATDVYMCINKNKKTGKADLTTSPVIL